MAHAERVLNERIKVLATIRTFQGPVLSDESPEARYERNVRIAHELARRNPGLTSCSSLLRELDRAVRMPNRARDLFARAIKTLG